MVSGARAPGCTFAVCPLLVQTHKTPRPEAAGPRRLCFSGAVRLPALRGAIVFTGEGRRPRGGCPSGMWPELWVNVSGSLGSTCFVFCVERSENRGVADQEGTERER